MKLFSSLAIAAVLTLAYDCAQPVQAQTQDPYQQYFQAWQEYQDALFVREDMAGFLKTLTPDHVSYDRKGHKTTLRQEKRELATAFKNIDAMDIKSQVGNVRVKGDVATITVASGDAMSIWNAHLQMEVNATSQTIEVKTLRRIKGKWYEASTRETMSKMWLEGREFPHE